MAVNYKRYLAEHVLNEQEHVTYRSLSRALKVHCNHAKRMLYDFHQSENAKTPNSVHATYIVIGVPDQVEKSPANGTTVKDEDEDEVMQSSPFMSSQPALQEEVEDAPPVTAVMLVREEELADVKSRFKTVFSIFMYSVQSTSPQDLNVLADLGYTLFESQLEDALEQGPRYGMIQNENVKRRTRVGAPAAPPPAEKPTPAEATSISKPTKRKEPSPKEEEEKPTPPAESTLRPTSQASTKPEKPTKPAERPSQPKRDNSIIFKAFAKAKPKAKKEESAAETESPAEPADVVMDDESGEEREDLFLDTGTRGSNKTRESRKDREDRLKQMMEDEDMPDAPEESPAEKTPVEEPAAQEEPQEAPAPEPEPELEPSEETSGSRRRRGRRQVMKKQQTRDAEGFIVTREEPVWESFSEEEPEPPKRKRPVSVAGKGGKGAGGGKPGQGSIMSFFGKKQ